MKEPIFVGRERELEELGQHLDQALAGRSQVCFIAGEAGSGKTALVYQFVQQALVANPDLIVAVGSCNAQTGIGDPYLPFREALNMLTGDAAQQSAGKVAAENANRLRAVVVRSVQVLVETAPELIGLFVPGATLLGTLGRAVVKKVGWMDQLDELAKRKVGLGAPVAEQSRIFEQYTAFLQRLSTKTPLILFLDDLQWADTASLGLLFHLGRHPESGRILILGAYRPNDVALGRDGNRHPLEPVVHELTRYHGDVTVDLDAIPDTVNQAFVDALLDAEPNALGKAFRQALFHQTGGHALFTVEMIRTLQERGDLVCGDDGRWVEGQSLDWDALPARVEGVIAERIARLSDELRELLRAGSVEGEQFTAEVVARVQNMSERQAIRRLSDDLQRRHRLVSAQGLIRLGHQQLSFYRFLHILFQQYLYGNLDEAERAYLHRDVGEVVEALFLDQTEEVADQLARHFEQGGVPTKAATYRLQAGMRALRMSAHQEAATHLIKGLELLSSLPQGPECMQLELGLQAALGVVSVANHGYASPQVERAFARTRDLAQACGALSYEIPALYGLCAYQMVRGNLNQAYEQGQQLLSLAEQAGHMGYAIGALQVMGAASAHQGLLGQARLHLEDAVARYDPIRDRDSAYSLGHDPKVSALCYQSFVLFSQGYPGQALAAKDAAIEVAQQLSHPYTLGFARSFASMLFHRLRCPAECKAQAKLALELGHWGPYPIWQAIGSTTHGWALAHLHQADDGIAEVERGLALWQGSGAGLALSYFHALQAEACLAAGRREEGLRAVDASFCNPAEMWWFPEQHRLRGELLLLAPGHEAEAEHSFRQAFDLAGQQQARMFELRSATGLARLLRQQGRTAEGRELLAECYVWFTEGFETPDLREARELLDQLCTDAGRPLAESEEHKT